MKNFLALILMFSSLAGFCGEGADFESECATRYIHGAENLVSNADDLNSDRISSAQYALNVALADGSIVSMRLACMNESKQAARCVEKTKTGYEKIRRKMLVSEVLSGSVKEVKVSELDLLRQLNGIIACRNFI